MYGHYLVDNAMCRPSDDIWLGPSSRRSRLDLSSRPYVQTFRPDLSSRPFIQTFRSYLPSSNQLRATYQVAHKSVFPLDRNVMSDRISSSANEGLRKPTSQCSIRRIGSIGPDTPSERKQL
ncbi:hypothetical protein Tco_0577481 [Tanacetum coccineum]